MLSRKHDVEALLSAVLILQLEMRNDRLPPWGRNRRDKRRPKTKQQPSQRNAEVVDEAWSGREGSCFERRSSGVSARRFLMHSIKKSPQAIRSLRRRGDVSGDLPRLGHKLRIPGVSEKDTAPAKRREPYLW